MYLGVFQIVSNKIMFMLMFEWTNYMKYLLRYMYIKNVRRELTFLAVCSLVAK